VTADLLWHVDTRVFPAAFDLLPGAMASREARALLLAIGLQESKFKHRVQVPVAHARGFWQFEKGGGIAGVLGHATTAPIIARVCDVLCYPPTSAACYEAVTDNDTLAACFARLLLWTDPRALPSPIEASKAWKIYLATWRPGKPHPATWAAHYATAWQAVAG
jgi:hypothetical protein